jgi:signal transduction histidine kinase
MGDWLGWAEGNRLQFAFVSAAISAFFCVFLVFRSPRNTFTGLLAAIVLSIAEWNFFEWYAGPDRPWAENLQFLGINLLPALTLHFAASSLGTRRRRPWWVVAGYVAAGVFSALALGALVPGPLQEYFKEGGRFNRDWLAVQVPILALAVALLGYGAVAGPREVRGVLRYVLAAALAAGLTGVPDMMKGADMKGARLANVGAALASVVLVFAAWRHRELFDSLSILRSETAGLLDRTRHGLVSFDAAGNTVFANELAATLLGGRPGSVADLDPALPGLLEKGGHAFLRRGERILRATVQPAGPRLSGATRHYLLLEDCTQENRLLAEMAQRETLASLGEATATMAHEIRNALTAVGTTIETLSREPDPDPEALRGLNGQVRRLNETMAKCLSLARVLPLDRQDCDLHRILRRVAVTIPAGPELRFGPEDGPAKVYADPDLLGQVFHNLLKNAAEAGAPWIRMGVRREGGEAIVTVENAGPPLRADVLPRLFEPFVTGKPEGTGLGLSLCRKVVAAHGGRISGRNVEGGVEFEVRLPWTS